MKEMLLISGTIFANYLASSPRNARYTSKAIQNELIGDNIHCDIFKEVKSAKHYFIIADEVTDASNKDSLSCSSVCLQ